MYHIPTQIRMKKVKNNSRTLSAQLPHDPKRSKSIESWKVILGISVVVFSLSFTVILVGLLHTTYSLYQHEVSEKNSAIRNLNYWQRVVEDHPHFPAAYYEAAVYAARLEEREKAKELLQKALTIDPNFFEAEALAKELEK